jgi:hypothetical protein
MREAESGKSGRKNQLASEEDGWSYSLTIGADGVAAL